MKMPPPHAAAAQGDLAQHLPHPAPAGNAALVHEALLLLARSHGGDAQQAQAAQAELQARSAREPAFAAACQVARQVWQATDGSALRESLSLPPSARERQGAPRRVVLGLMGVAALTLGLGATGRWLWLRPTFAQALATGQGEIQRLRLPDGSELALDAQTRLRVALYRQRRELHLERGEIHLQAAPDANSPLTVFTAQGRVQALGTRFSVAVRQAHMHVAVAQGRVAVWVQPDAPAQAAQAAPSAPLAELGAGQQLRIGPGHSGTPQPIDAADVGAWQGGMQDGWLVFHAAPLPEVVARWNGYLRPGLRLAGNAQRLQGLRLTGSFPIRDPGAFLASLPRTLPVRVQRQGDGAWLIAPR
ncbi:MAG: FecR domain-containing protein [Comamonadaceae bacterium]|nr:FecR domain-containing protein [Comamonadaceae bacterium]